MSSLSVIKAILNPQSIIEQSKQSSGAALKLCEGAILDFSKAFTEEYDASDKRKRIYP